MRLVCGFIAFVAALASARAADGTDRVRYNRDIRPILSDNCFQCHGPDKAQRKAGLRLDVRESALEQGAIVPGDLEGSELIWRVTTDDLDNRMPPAQIHKTLSAEQKGLLRRWIEEGAEYEAHWAYLPVVRPPVPTPGYDSGALSPIDLFIRARLKKEGLEPAPEAGRATLLRRLSLDLTGLPPTPEEADAFINDASPLAFEREVERLLASPHFGERMAIPWLDAVRFADTVGYHGDQNQRIFPYRDYVIESFNENKPFDVFTVEQLAGDLLPDPTIEQLVATGFNRLNMMTREGGAQPKEYLAKYQADRVRTVSTAWLGATMACSECHDHKFDPFTARDFYSMSAFFADIQQWGVYNDYSYTPNPDLKGWSNDHPFPPEIQVESPYLKRRLARLTEREQALCSAATARLHEDQAALAAYRAWRAEIGEFLRRHSDGWISVPVARVETRDGKKLEPATNATALPDRSLRFDARRASSDVVTFELPAGWMAALRLELLPFEPAGGMLRGDLGSGTIRLSAKLRIAEKEQAVAFSFADSPDKLPVYANGHEMLGVQGGWRVSKEPVGQARHGIWLLEEPVRLESGTRLIVALEGNAAARVRLSTSPLAIEPSDWPRSLGALRGALLENAWTLQALVPPIYYRSTGQDAPLAGQLRALDAERRECRGGRAWTMITVATNAMATRILPRGNWMDESGEIVEPAPPHFLPPRLSFAGKRNRPEGKGDTDPDRDEEKSGRRLTRLDLARWIVSPENPLTARHFANHLWAQFFGAGISARIEDLGLQGEWPTHPELLDWLAAEFMAPSRSASPITEVPPPHPWDIKHLVRLIVNSATYRQDTVPSPLAREMDPENKLLSHQSPRRLEAELVRDNALAIAGLINLDVGGPSVFPYQPPGYYANLQFPDRHYQANEDERQYRRGVYMHWQRTFLHPMLANFDAQSREECVAARLVSNTPQQALTLLNDPTFVEASRVLAQMTLKAAARDEDRVDFMMRRALLRHATPAERNSLLRLLGDLRKTCADRPEDAQKLLAVGLADVPEGIPPEELAAWTNLARTVLNLHETITRY
jgi:hypothetical protein